MTQTIVLAYSGGLDTSIIVPWLKEHYAGARVVCVAGDVGQGDAIALRTPRWRWSLADAGDQWRDTDAGIRIVVPYLQRRGGPIAALILSHPHADHIGGAASVIRKMPVGFVWDGGYAQSSSVYAKSRRGWPTPARRRRRCRRICWRSSVRWAT